MVASDHRRNDRHFDDALPYRTVVELNGHAVGRIERAFVPRFYPHVTRKVDPAARWHAGFVHQVQLPVRLRQISKRRRADGRLRRVSGVAVTRLALLARRCVFWGGASLTRNGTAQEPPLASGLVGTCTRTKTQNCSSEMQGRPPRRRSNESVGLRKTTTTFCTE
jgi:hypothetical protein